MSRNGLAGVTKIEAAKARLLEAGAELRGRPAAEILEALGAVLESWRDPTSPWRRRLEAELPAATGFTPATVREGLARGLAPWSASALCSLVERELGSVAALEHDCETEVALGFELYSVLLAGSIPMPTLLALLLPLVLRAPVLAKSASRDPLTAHLVRESLSAADPLLRRCVELVDFETDDAERVSSFLSAPCVVASGSAETLGSVRSKVAAHQRFVAYGHRVSIAVVGPDALGGTGLGAVCEGLALDTALWDQLGCLSPVAVYALGPDPAETQSGARRLADELAGALARAEPKWPRGGVDKAAAALARAELGGAEMRRAAGQEVDLFGGAGASWSVVLEADAQWRAAPLHRFLRVHPVRDLAELRAGLAPVAPYLSAVALAGFEDTSLRRDWASALLELGASRLCSPGSLQAPPLSWRHDGQPLLVPLARLASWDRA